jgi:xylan 1,4-beta-xylosidase
MRRISADLGRTAGRNTRNYSFCVGGGRAYETLLAENQRHLEIARRECGFRYLRFHGLLHDDMGVYAEDRSGRPVYNWQYVDLLYDFILKIGMKPFVELSFMPSALASGTQTVFFWRGNVTMPKDPEKWSRLIEALARHWISRYGSGEVRTWLFEVWNEPNLNYFFASEKPFEDYMKLYEITAKALKRADPELKVGGPATAGCAWIPEFIEACRDRKLPLDFVSTHSYGVEGFVDEFGEDLQKLIPDEDSVASDVAATARKVKASPMPGLPVHFTEWNSSYSSRDNIHDSYHQAAFLLTRIKKAAAAVDSMSYWTFSDVFEEAGPGPSPFHGGFGLLNIQGLRKPAFFAYRFLNLLGDTMLECGDARALAAKDESGAQVLFWDYAIPDQKVSDQEYYVQDLPPKEAEPVGIRLEGLKPGRYFLELYGVGYRMNDVYTLYRELGAHGSLSPKETEYLDESCFGRPVLREWVEVGETGRFEYGRDMRENDVYLLRLIRA